MNEQRERAREDRKKMGDLGWQSEDLGLDKSIKTAFDGYTHPRGVRKDPGHRKRGRGFRRGCQGREDHRCTRPHPVLRGDGRSDAVTHGVITGKNGAMTVSDVQKTTGRQVSCTSDVVTERRCCPLSDDGYGFKVDAAYRQAICRCTYRHPPAPEGAPHRARRPC